MKYYIITLGCKVNSYESNFMSESLSSNGFIMTNNSSDADIIIINTCTVTDTSDKKSLKMVRRMRRENPNSILVVCGCSSQNKENLYKNLNINILLGNKNKSKIVDILNNYLKNNKNYEYITKNRDLPFEDMLIERFDQVRAYMKVQDGCNNFCSYCIIPFVRGSIRSKNFDLCIKEANVLANNGFKEIVLTGIHTGSYNDSNYDLVDLINEMSKIDGIKRIRLSSVEITELNDKFMDMLKNNSKFCHHLHVPLQSGCNEMLKIMNRKYDTKYFENKINLIRSIIPDVSITTDVIVGHNYETDELFNKTYDFCKKVNFAKIHVFPYSKRTGTKASLMPESVSENIKKERCKKLISLSEKLEKDFYNKFLNTDVEVLIEEIKNNKSIGHTSNYLRLEIDEVLEVNKFYKRKVQ